MKRKKMGRDGRTEGREGRPPWEAPHGQTPTEARSEAQEPQGPKARACVGLRNHEEV